MQVSRPPRAACPARLFGRSSPQPAPTPTPQSFHGARATGQAAHGEMLFSGGAGLVPHDLRHHASRYFKPLGLAVQRTSLKMLSGIATQAGQQMGGSWLPWPPMPLWCFGQGRTPAQGFAPCTNPHQHQAKNPGSLAGLGNLRVSVMAFAAHTQRNLAGLGQRHGHCLPGRRHRQC